MEIVEIVVVLYPDGVLLVSFSAWFASGVYLKNRQIVELPLLRPRIEPAVVEPSILIIIVTRLLLSPAQG